MERRLGRGLDSLIARTVETEDSAAQEIPLSEIAFNPNQPRKAFDEAALEGLAQSIRHHGVLQPVVVRRVGRGYELIAGERRCRASKLAGRTRIPAVVVEAPGLAALEMALIENIQREDLGPLEESTAFADLLSTSGMTHAQLAERLGKSRAAISNALRLLELPEAVKQHLRDGLLSAGQARTLLAAGDAAAQEKLAEEAVTRKLSVRELERRVKEPRRAGASPGARTTTTGDGTERSASGGRSLAHKGHYEEKLRNLYGTKVTVADQEGRGEVRLSFYSARDRDRLIAMLLTASARTGEYHAD